MTTVRRRLVLAVVGGALLTTACQTPLSFSRDDPVGYNACRSLFAMRDSDDPAEIAELEQAVLEAAHDAETQSIREAVDPTTGVIDEDAMASACTDAGFDPAEDGDTDAV